MTPRQTWASWPAHPAEAQHKLATHQVLDWLKERESNATRIASTKKGAERDGWLEDAAYFQAAARIAWEYAGIPKVKGSAA